MSQPLRILQLTDLHILSERGKTMAEIDTFESFKKTIQHAHQQHQQYDLILLTGDLAQDPVPASYLKINQILQQYPGKVICLPGNHDDFAIMQQVFNNSRIDCSKHYLFENWQIVCLNSKKNGSPSGYLCSYELDYLQERLKQYPDLNTIIAVHHHPVEIGSPWMDGMMIENHMALLSIIANKQYIKAIICGHIHQEFFTEQNNTAIYGTPSTCFQFKAYCSVYTLDSKGPGYRTLFLHSDGKLDSMVYRIPA